MRDSELARRSGPGSALRSWLEGFRPAVGAVERRELLRSALGALIGLTLTGVVSHLWIRDAATVLLLIAPMGASAVLLFAVPASPLAQPWSILAGNLISAAVGVGCQLWCPWPWLTPGLAGALAIAAMLALRCLHPPSGAVALTAVLGGPAIHALGFGYVLAPVGINTGLILACALCFNPLAGRRYPHGHGARGAPASVPPYPRSQAFTVDDLDLVLRARHDLLDVSRDDLEEILRDTEAVAFERRFGRLSCGSVMDPEVPALEFGTPLAEAWVLLRTRRLEAVAVVDRARRVIGTLSQSDFVEHANPERFAHVGPAIGQLIRRITPSHNETPEAVGQIMNRRFWQVQATQPVIELVPLMQEKRVTFLPVVDAERRLVGMLSMTQVLDALHSTVAPQGALPQSE